MNETASDRIWAFIAEETAKNVKSIQSDEDVFEKLKLHGDDCFDFMDEYFRRFDVEETDYLWYFHHGEEGSGGIGGGFFLHLTDGWNISLSLPIC